MLSVHHLFSFRRLVRDVTDRSNSCGSGRYSIPTPGLHSHRWPATSDEVPVQGLVLQFEGWFHMLKLLRTGLRLLKRTVNG